MDQGVSMTVEELLIDWGLFEVWTHGERGDQNRKNKNESPPSGRCWYSSKMRSFLTLINDKLYADDCSWATEALMF